MMWRLFCCCEKFFKRKKIVSSDKCDQIWRTFATLAIPVIVYFVLCCVQTGPFYAVSCCISGKAFFYFLMKQASLLRKTHLCKCYFRKNVESIHILAKIYLAYFHWSKWPTFEQILLPSVTKQINNL